MATQAHELVEMLDLLAEEADSAGKKNAEGARLSAQELRCLRAVGRERCCIMSAIASAIRLSLSSATGLIDRLVEKKLVRRERSADDRRVVQVELTEEGRAAHEAALAGRVDYAQRLLETLEPHEQATLVALFGKLAAQAKVRKAGA